MEGALEPWEWCTLARSFIGDSGAFLCTPMKIGVKSEHCGGERGGRSVPLPAPARRAARWSSWQLRRRPAVFDCHVMAGLVALPSQKQRHRSSSQICCGVELHCVRCAAAVKQNGGGLAMGQ